MNKTLRFKPGDLGLYAGPMVHLLPTGTLLEILDKPCTRRDHDYVIRAYGFPAPRWDGYWEILDEHIKPISDPDALDIDSLAGLVPSHVLGTLRSERVTEGA